MNKFCKSISLLAIAMAIPVCLSAQTQTETTTTPKSSTHVLSFDSATVAYVSGDDAVLRLPDGSLRLFELIPGTPLMIDGKEAQPSDLKPGMNLTHVQLRSRTTSEVSAVETFSGTITAKNGRFLTLRLEDGTSKIYRVPFHATFNVNGRDTAFSNITTGNRITVTAVTTSGLNSHSTRGTKVATTPSQEGTLVVTKE